AQDSRPARPARQRHPAADHRGEPGRGSRRVPVRAVPDEVLPDQDADPIRDLLPRLRTSQRDLPVRAIAGCSAPRQATAPTPPATSPPPCQAPARFPSTHCPPPCQTTARLPAKSLPNFPAKPLPELRNM